MITLYQWPTKTSLPNSGMFCLKLESYLRLMKIEHNVMPTVNMSKSPKKTMPYIEMDGNFISDSQIIMNMFEKKSSNPMDGYLNSQQISLTAAYRSLIENKLVNSIIYFRWFTDLGWAQFSRLIFSGAPAPVRIIFGGHMRKNTIKTLYRTGFSRHSEIEILEFADQALSSAAELLGNQNYVFGDKISTLDLSLFAITANILHSQINTPLITLVQKYPRLSAHCERVMQHAFDRGF